MGLHDPIVFVGGSQRSGTTLLRNMLTAHPELALPDESPFVHQIHRRLEHSGRLEDLGLAWRLIRDNARFQQWRLAPQDVDRLLELEPPGSYAELVRVLFAAFAHARGKEHSGDKTTWNALRFGWLARLFPTSRFVHVLRDPREVCMSRAVQSFNAGGLVGAARHWRAHVTAARASALALGPQQLEVRYEELVRRPVQELERLCGFLGLPFRPSMLRYGTSADVLPRHDQDVLAREPVQLRVRPWRTQLSRDELSLIEFVAGPLMDEVGYPRELGVLTPRAALALGREGAARGYDRWLDVGAPILGRLLHELGTGVRGRSRP